MMLNGFKLAYTKFQQKTDLKYNTTYYRLPKYRYRLQGLDRVYSYDRVLGKRIVS